MCITGTHTSKQYTQSDLILRLVEMLLEQKEQNNNQPKVEENKKSKD